MTRRRALAFAAAACLAASRPAGAAPLPEAPEGGGWVETKASLLLFSPDGFLSQEIGLGEWTEDLPDGLKARRRMKGGASADGRFAWHWQMVETVRPGGEEPVLGSTRTLVYLGTSGQVLWDDGAADSPDGVEPLRQSGDGETALVVERSASGWSAALFAYTGNVLRRIDVGPRLLRASLTPNGRFIHLLWSGTDSPLIHTFYDAHAGAREDIPAARAQLGEASIDEKGVVRSGEKILHRFP